jgi:acyl-CoA thioester hydrolase
MQFFTKTIQVASEDLDALNHVNNVRYVQWINDIAKAHWTQEATSEQLNDYFWVVIKHVIQYKSPAFLNDVLLLKTYVSHSEGVTSTRVVEIVNNNTNKLLVHAETDYCLIDAKTERPSRIPTELIELFD